MQKILTASDFKLELKRGLSGGYLFFGPENYLASHYSKEARKSIAPESFDDDFSCRRIDAALSQDPLGELYESLSTMSGFGGKRIVEISGLNIDKLKSSEFEQLLDCCYLSDELAILILRTSPDLFDVGYLPKRPSQRFTALCEILIPVSFEYEAPQRLNKWITSHFAARTVACEPEISQFIITRCGRDMSKLNTEIAKLSAFVLSQGRNKVTKEDVTLISVASEESGAFDFSNAITEGDTAKAIVLLADMKEQKEKPEIILATVSRIIGEMFMVSSLSEKGGSKAEIAKMARLHEYKVSIYLNRLSRLPSDYSEKALKRCLECDRQMKATALDSYSAIERLILSL